MGGDKKNMKANTEPIFSSLLGGIAAAGTEFLQHLFLPRTSLTLGRQFFTPLQDRVQEATQRSEVCQVC